MSKHPEVHNLMTHEHITNLPIPLKYIPFGALPLCVSPFQRATSRRRNVPKYDLQVRRHRARRLLQTTFYLKVHHQAGT